MCPDALLYRIEEQGGPTLRVGLNLRLFNLSILIKHPCVSSLTSLAVVR